MPAGAFTFLHCKFRQFFIPSALYLPEDHHCNDQTGDSRHDPGKRIGSNGNIVIVHFDRIKRRDHSRAELDKSKYSCKAGVTDGLNGIPVDEDYGQEEIADSALRDVCGCPWNVCRYIHFGIEKDPQNMR